MQDIINTAKQITRLKAPVQIAPHRLGDPVHIEADASKVRTTLEWGLIRSDLDAILREAWHYGQYMTTP